MKNIHIQKILIPFLISMTLVLSACGGQGSVPSEEVSGNADSTAAGASKNPGSPEGSGASENAGSADSLQNSGLSGSADSSQNSIPSDRPDSPASFSGLKKTGSMERVYAECFSADYYEGGFSLITIMDEGSFLLVPEGSSVPAGVPDEITVLHQNPKNVYLAASSVMDFFRALDSLDHVRLTSTKKEDWSLPEVVSALTGGEMLYTGKYNTPDYEQILLEKCEIAIESTMIHHSPKTKEQLELLRIPVLVDRSSYEPHPLGRMEWIRLYGLLLGCEDAASDFFDRQAALYDEVAERLAKAAQSPKSAAFFYITSNGSANVRRPGDYISRMIELAGGRYIFRDLPGDDSSASATQTIDLETFYAGAKDADIMFYSSSIGGEIDTTEELLAKSALLADCKAVTDGNVWCADGSLYQQTTGTADMIREMNLIFTGQADDAELRFFHKVK